MDSTDDTPPSPESSTLRELADALTAVAREVGTDPGGRPLQRLVEMGASDLVGAEHASVTVLRSGTFRTIVASDDVATAIDVTQYETGSGPCVDAILDDATFVSAEIADDDRWSDVGRVLRDAHGVRSMLAYRLHLLNEDETIAGLNFSSSEAGAFTDDDIVRGTILASHCALLVTATLAETKAENLLKGLQSNREIGIAVGVLMARHGLTRQQAFDVLRVASQDSNRKIADIAVEVGDTGLAPIDLDHPRL